jgi:hypothetical protein
VKSPAKIPADQLAIDRCRREETYERSLRECEPVLKVYWL